MQTTGTGWLILVENQEKALSFRKALKDATCISSKGMPWDIEVEIAGPSLLYKKVVKETYKELLKRILAVAEECNHILLAFDPSTTGEAAAVEFEQFLGVKKCTRWTANSLLSTDIQKTINQLESFSPKELPRSNKGLASSYWCQTTIDITWTSKISTWLQEKTSRTEKITRLMGGMLKTIADEQRKKEIFHSYTYFEIATSLKKQKSGKKVTATIIVPTFAQLGGTTPNKTRDIWKRRMEEARNSTILGTGIPQPEPGKPWRYKNWEDVALQKNHIQKFPFFLVESIASCEIESEVKPPLTNSTILKIGQKTGKGKHEEIQRSLMELYYEGYITYPKTNSPNLWKKSVESLIQYGETKQLNLTKELRDFSEEENPRAKFTEALRPTLWTRKPEEIDLLLAPSANKTLKSWLYRIIHQRAIGSQLASKTIVKKKHYLIGPLYLTKKGAAEREGKPFTIKKEHTLQAHMNVIMCFEEDNQKEEIGGETKQGEVLECTNTQINNKKSEAPNTLTEEELFDLMGSEGLGKWETLKNLLGILKKQGCVHIEKEITLTPKGRSLTTILNNNFGQFLDQNYHRTIAENLKMIEECRLEEEEFLQEWWSCFRTFLEDDQLIELEQNLWEPAKNSSFN